MIDLQALRRRLDDARARREAAANALAAKHKGGEWEEYQAAHALLLDAERNLAAANHDEYAVPLDFSVPWDTGAPLPQLLKNDHHAFLVFRVKCVDPDWDGSYTTVKDPASDKREPLALVEFKRCLTAKLGGPNDEVLEGHPLSGKGLDPYSAQRVVNSRWLAELERINSVHSCYSPEGWRALHHYVVE